MTTRVLLICAVAPETAAFPADHPASGSALGRLYRMSLPANPVCRCSPLLRAQQTATALGLAATVEPALAEADFGSWQGREPTALLASEPAGFAQWLCDPTAAPHGGESFAAMARRVVLWLDGLAGTDRYVVGVTHPGPMQAVLLHVLGAPLSSARAVAVKPLSRLRLTHDARRWSVQMGA